MRVAAKQPAEALRNRAIHPGGSGEKTSSGHVELAVMAATDDNHREFFFIVDKRNVVEP